MDEHLTEWVEDDRRNDCIVFSNCKAIADSFGFFVISGAGDARGWLGEGVSVLCLLLTFRSFEEDGDQRRQVALSVPEREVVWRESSSRQVLDVANVLNVRGILALARYPHYVCL